MHHPGENLFFGITNDNNNDHKSEIVWRMMHKLIGGLGGDKICLLHYSSVIRCFSIVIKHKVYANHMKFN